MNTGLIAARYAEALADYAREQGVEEQVYADSLALTAKLREVSKIGGDMASKEILESAVAGCSGAMQRFLQIVLRNGRAAYLVFILNTFERRYRWEHGIAKARIVTANETWQPVLKDRVEQFLYSNGWSKVEFRFAKDESLIGGYVLQLRDQRVDASIATQLRVLSNELTEKNHRL